MVFRFSNYLKNRVNESAKTNIYATFTCSFFIGIGVDVFACTDPDANFSVDNTTPIVGQTVTFTNTTNNHDGNVNKWEWDFGSGATPATATTKNVAVTRNYLSFRFDS